jgi:hypothetical protein
MRSLPVSTEYREEHIEEDREESYIDCVGYQGSYLPSKVLRKLHGMFEPSIPIDCHLSHSALRDRCHLPL